ncbi:MAG: hypothetical protein ACREI2_07070 [Nitrospiraceae bacterium]
MAWHLLSFALMEVGKPHASQIEQPPYSMGNSSPAGGIFALDVWTLQGVPVPMLSVALVLGSAWMPPRRSTLRVVAGCTILTLLGSILPPPSLTIWFLEANPALVLASMWVAAVIVRLQKRAEGCCDRGRARQAEERTKAGGSALSLLVMT